MRNKLFILTAVVAAAIAGAGCSSQKASNSASDAAAWKPSATPPAGYAKIVAHSGPSGAPPAPPASTNP